MYLVCGGVFKDFMFDWKDKETFEDHGCYETYEEAYVVWKKYAWLNVDNALHRIMIVKET